MIRLITSQVQNKNKQPRLAIGSDVIESLSFLFSRPALSKVVAGKWGGRSIESRNLVCWHIKGIFDGWNTSLQLVARDRSYMLAAWWIGLPGIQWFVPAIMVIREIQTIQFPCLPNTASAWTSGGISIATLPLHSSHCFPTIVTASTRALSYFPLILRASAQRPTSFDQPATTVSGICCQFSVLFRVSWPPSPTTNVSPALPPHSSILMYIRTK